MVERYGLKFNPFPRAEAEQYRNEPEKLDIILFDYEKRKLVEYAKAIQNATVSFAVVGPWGTGKTLFLLYFYKLLRQLYGVDKVKFIYIKAPLDNEDIVKRLCNELGIPTSGRRLADLLEMVRQRVKDLVVSGYIVYIALDQLEMTYQNISHDPVLTREFSEIVRGRLSAMVERGYALGVSALEFVWSEIVNKIPSMAGIESIRLRTLMHDEVKIFILKYLEKARDLELIKRYNLEKEVKENPIHPFTDDAVVEIYRLSGGIQRNICSWAYELLEKSKDKLDKIDSFVVRLVVDRKLYLRQRSLEEILPYHPMRAAVVVREILSYIWDRHGSKYNIIWIGPIDRDTFLINVAGKNTIVHVVTRQTLEAEDLQDIVKYLQEGVTIDNERIDMHMALVLHFVSQSTPPSKLIEPKASLIFVKFGDKLKRKVILRDAVDAWGRLAAFYLFTRDVLPSYIMSEDEEEVEIKEILKILSVA
jgi:hypothetical protein